MKIPSVTHTASSISAIGTSTVQWLGRQLCVIKDHVVQAAKTGLNKLASFVNLFWEARRPLWAVCVGFTATSIGLGPAIVALWITEFTEKRQHDCSDSGHNRHAVAWGIATLALCFFGIREVYRVVFC
jgi:hypothetical protein